MVVVTLIEALARLMAHTNDPAVLRFMMQQAEVTAQASLGAPHDLQKIQAALARTRETLERRLMEIE
ncbi:hypothetical protein D9M68_950990 [compost metagenome]